MICTSFSVPCVPFLGGLIIINDPPKNDEFVQHSRILGVNNLLKANCLNCRYFSGSPYLRCAVNPQKQPSAECPDFEVAV